MTKHYGVDVEKQREKLLKSEVAKGLISNIINLADSVLDREYPALKMSDYMLCFETGDRTVYEKACKERLNNCSYIWIAYWLTEDEKYKKPLCDLIFHICDEYTWCLPAHAHLIDENPPSSIAIETVDLFQAETVFMLVDIAIMIGDKLPHYVTDRIKYEVRRRVVVPLTKYTFPWMEEWCVTNWAAVCASGSLLAVLKYATEDEKTKILPVLEKCVEHFLSGYKDDGCCMEGYTYWKFGYGHFILYAALIYDYSNGKINYFDIPKVKEISLYLQRVRMGKDSFVTFSDSDLTFEFEPGLICFLKKMYGSEFKCPDLKYMSSSGLAMTYSVTNLLWFDTDYEADEDEYKTVFFKESQWYVNRGKNYSFAAKGGHNNEQHNHNDVGSFMIVAKDESDPLTDLGRALYVNGTFDDKIRYTLINNGSQGHSLPIINGETQKPGAEYGAKNVVAGDHFFEVDIEGAYEKGLINRIHRRFDLKEDCIEMCDTFEYSSLTKEIKERLVTRIKPEIIGNVVDLKSAQIIYDKESYDISVTKDKYRNRADTMDMAVYLIDFVPRKSGNKEFKILIEL